MKRFPAPFQFQPLAFSLQPFPKHWLAGVLARERPALFRDLPESFKIGHPLPDHSLTRLRHPLPSDGRGKPGGAAAPPYHKSKTVGLTCRSAQISGIRSNMSRPASRFAAGFSLNPQLSTLNHLTGVLSVATISISSNHFDKIRQFLPGMEINPLAGRIRIGQALVFFALNPCQVLVS